MVEKVTKVGRVTNVFTDMVDRQTADGRGEQRDDRVIIMTFREDLP